MTKGDFSKAAKSLAAISADLASLASDPTLRKESVVVLEAAIASIGDAEGAVMKLSHQVARLELETQMAQIQAEMDALDQAMK